MAPRRTRSVRKNRKVAKWLALVFAILLVLTLPLSCVGSGQLLLVKGDLLTSTDVILALGNPALDDGRPGEIMEARTRRAVALHAAGYAPTLLFTGGAVQNEFAEAEVMADLAVSLGVPREDIVLEMRAQNTIENMQYVAALMREEGWRSALLVTSPYHLERSLTLAEAAGVNVVGYAQARRPLTLWEHMDAITHEYLTLALFYVSPE